MSLKASISGIRGIVGESLTPQIIVDYICAFCQILPKGDILIGRDSRVTGKMVENIVCSVLNACGRDVTILGIVPTPVVLFGVKNHNYAGGIIITASHNPAQWNALKLVNEQGKFISPDQFKQLNEKLTTKCFHYAEYRGIGIISEDITIPKQHISKLLTMIDQVSIKETPFKVVIDAVNGAGGEQTIQFLNQLNCDVIPINTEPSGIFAHEPEPKPENLAQLSEAVKKHRADIGFALDPDADRLVIAGSDGEVLSEELTLALCVKHYLKHYNKTDVVINLSTSKMIEDVCDEYQVKLWRVPTGEINVTEKMEQINADIGGEGNGGIIFSDFNKCRDALAGIGLILEMMVKEKKGINQLASTISQYYMVKDKISSVDLDFEMISNKIMKMFEEYPIDTQDGIRIDFPDKWVLFRQSNTEPIIRIFAEAKSKDKALELINTVKEMCN